MTTESRSLAWTAVPALWLGAVLALFTIGCSSGPPPVVTPPDPPPPVCDGRDVVIYTLDEASRPIPDVAIHSSEGPGAGRNSDGNGFSHRWACGPADYTLLIEGWHTVNCGEPGASCNLAGPEHRIHFARDALPEPPPPPPPVHPEPVVGAMWADNQGCFGDDTGYRTFTIFHNGDALLRWAAGGKAKVLSDWDRAAEAGYHVIRLWSHIRPSNGQGVWSRGGDPAYDGFDFITRPDAIDIFDEMATAAAARGMRLTLESGGIDGINTDQERRMMERFNEALHRTGAWKVSWVAPVNEPHSVHGTSDDNGDNSPQHLRMLVDILRRGTNVLWHLGGTSNTDWDNPRNRFSQGFYTAADQKFGYYHGSRAGRVTDKIRHHFSWAYEGGSAASKRCWVDGEGPGAPTSGPPLRYVSVVQNGHEMSNPEALPLIVAQQTMRGMGVLMSGNGVQVHRPWDQVVAFRQVPWLVRQLHRDVGTFDTFHHSGDRWRGTRVLAVAPHTRVDGSIHRDGRFDYILNFEQSGTHRFPVEKSFVAKLCDPGPMVCQDVSARKGETFTVSGTFGRLLTGNTIQ
jgi:hypothetical protein